MITDAEILDLWGHVRHLDGVDRLAALAAATGDDAVDGWTVGRAHAAVLSLQEALAGPLDATVTCPGCGEVVEFMLDPAAVRTSVEHAAPPTPVAHDGWHVRWRPVTLGLLRWAGQAGDVAAADARLLAGVVEQVKTPDGGEADIAELPDDVRVAVEAAVAATDPLVEVVVSVRCAACATGLEAEVDLAAHTAAALAARAVALLDDVAVLARAYGWTEDEVLALPAWRRVAYRDEAIRGPT